MLKSKRAISIQVIFFWVMLIVPASAVELRIAIRKAVTQVQLGSSTPAVVKNASGKVLGEIEPMIPVSAQANSGGLSIGQWRSGQLIIEPRDNGYVWIGDRWYRGKTRLIRQGSGVTAINLVDIEEYLYSVVGAETYPSWPIEALKAQAVAARTYALYQRQQKRNQIYDLETTVASQVYKGLESEFLTTQDAVNATRGEVITYNGKVIMAVFHSSSGGHTENVEDIWTSPLPYLRGVEDFDTEAPVFQWNATFSPQQLTQRIGGVGNVKQMIPEKTTPRGRVVTMKIVGDRGSKILKGSVLRDALDLRSTLFEIIPVDGSFQISGRGYGHGLGLSQWGAYSLSLKGWDYRQILAHYYQRTTISPL